MTVLLTPVSGPAALRASRAPAGAGLTMAFKHIEAAKLHWRKLDGGELIPLVRAGVRFADGKQVERENENTPIDQRRKAAGLVILNKVDVLPYVVFNSAHFERMVRQVNPRARVIPLSATRGDGL